MEFEYIRYGEVFSKDVRYPTEAARSSPAEMRWRSLYWQSDHYTDLHSIAKK
jgi:hypothetical protein